MRTDWKSLITFSKKDRNAAIVLLVLIVLTILVIFFYPSNHPVSVVITTLDQELTKQHTDTSAIANKQMAYEPSEESEVNNSTIELFQFDPNTLDAAGFKRLGLQEKVINTIIKYRSKGGHFWKADDLKKIYSLRKEDAYRLIPYIQIAGQQQTFAKAGKEETNYTKTKPVVIDINAATVEQWKALPAIGDALANRIVKFRDKMGGFQSVAQVKQTYGLSDDAFKMIEPYLTLASAPQKNTTTEKINTNTAKININTASANQLKSNPNIPEEVAQAIVIYRSQHGNYASVEDVKKIVFINDELYKKISPYISVE